MTPLFLLLTMGCTPDPSPSDTSPETAEDTGPVEDDPNEPEIWYMVIGQSNACGGAQEETGTAPGRAYRGKVRDWVEPIEDPLCGIYQTTNGPWVSFAREHGYPIGLVVTAKGGTCLLPDEEAQATDGKEARWDPETGDLYETAVLAWQGAGSPPLAGAFWHQGECEATRGQRLGRTNDETREAYKAGLINLAEAVQRDFGTVLVAAPLSLKHPLGETQLFVHQAITEASRESDLVLLGPYHDHLLLAEDNAHIGEVNELGRLWYQATESLR